MAANGCSTSATRNSKPGGHWRQFHYYRMDTMCFSGGPNAQMIYLLASGKAPVGSMPEEQCESFDATRISLVQYGDFWKILSGAEELYDFGNKEKEATRALLALRHHEF